MIREIYTIGHSNRCAPDFLSLLFANDINVVADVRSKPHSRNNPHFDRESIIAHLAEGKIRYVFLGQELGGRPPDESCYHQGKVNYEMVARSPFFQEGLRRIELGIQRNFRIALMCTEKDPLLCHRAILISRQLVERQIQVKHILDFNIIETHATSVNRLLKSLGICEIYQDRTAVEQIDIAYAIQGRNIAFERRNGKPIANKSLPLT
jgi:uncharacterized protein (DUF488 family)